MFNFREEFFKVRAEKQQLKVKANKEFEDFAEECLKELIESLKSIPYYEFPKIDVLSFFVEGLTLYVQSTDSEFVFSKKITLASISKAISALKERLRNEGFKVKELDFEKNKGLRFEVKITEK